MDLKLRLMIKKDTKLSLDVNSMDKYQIIKFNFKKQEKSQMKIRA